MSQLRKSSTAASLTLEDTSAPNDARTAPPLDSDSSGSGDRSAVDHVLGACDGTRSRRGHECDEFCDLAWLGRASKRNAAERPHDDLLAALVVGAGLFRQALGQRA